MATAAFSLEGGVIDGADALREAIFLRLATARGVYAIHSDGYGIDLCAVYDSDACAARSRLKRAIEETLLEDERVLRVTDFEFAKKRGATGVTFTVKSIYGDLEVQSDV